MIVGVNLYRDRRLHLLRRAWVNAELPPALYHATQPLNVASVLTERRLVPNGGVSVCGSNNGFVSLSDRITMGIVEFFGNVVFELDAVSFYSRNPSVAPRDYGIAEDDIDRYDELPFFENEWRHRGPATFDAQDINKVLLLTAGGCRDADLAGIADLLQDCGIAYLFLRERALPDKINSDTARYFSRLEKWRTFQKRLGSVATLS